MEMNRYLIAALYVMAGCAVTVPLKAQTGEVSLGGGRCGLMMANTAKIIAVCLEQEEKDFPLSSPDYAALPQGGFASDDSFFDKTVRIGAGTLCWRAYKIRAPGWGSSFEVREGISGRERVNGQ